MTNDWPSWYTILAGATTFGIAVAYIWLGIPSKLFNSDDMRSTEKEPKQLEPKVEPETTDFEDHKPKAYLWK